MKELKAEFQIPLSRGIADKQQVQRTDNLCKK